jgi:hypothetical protein
MLSEEQTWRANQMTKSRVAVAVWGFPRRSRIYWNLCKYLWDFNTVGESKAYQFKIRGERVRPLCCLRCRREIEVGDKSVAVYMFAQTVGVKPRQKSTAQRICFCPQCAVSLAMGLPPDGALNMVAWR